MVDKLKRWAAPIAVVIMLWVAWSGLHGEVAKRAERSRLPAVELADLPLRDASETLVELGDPCRLREQVIHPSPAALAAARASTAGAEHSSSQSVELPGSRVAELPGSRVAEPPGGRVAQRLGTDLAPAPERVSRVLTLDAILVASVGAQAFISGQTVAVGSTIEGVDPEDPPILTWIDGVRAGVSWRNREYVLDLDRARRVTLGAANSAARPEAGP